MSTDIKAGDTVYLVKYALSDKPAKEVVRGADEDGAIWLLGYSSYFMPGRDAFATWPEALAAIEAMRAKKIAALKKQIAKLEKMEWSEPT